MKEELWRKLGKTIRIENNNRNPFNSRGLAVTLFRTKSNSHAGVDLDVTGPQGGSHWFQLELTAQDLGQLEELFREGRQSLESVTPEPLQDLGRETHR
jgi:hypothetical protein